jgi:hypothetical protein
MTGAALALNAALRLPIGMGEGAVDSGGTELVVQHFTRPVLVSEELLADCTGGYLVPTEYLATLMAVIQDRRMMRG